MRRFQSSRMEPLGSCKVHEGDEEDKDVGQ